MLFSRDNYPYVMTPAAQKSPYYAIYFIPILIINTFLLVPMPIAIMYAAFKVKYLVLKYNDIRINVEKLC